MLLGLDHLVVAVRDPDAAAAELARVVGLTCTGGGRHPLWGTFNRLAWLGDTYVELIGVFDASLTGNGAVSRVVAAALAASPWDRDPGLVAWTVATDDLDGDLARFRAAGSDLGDPERRSRTRPDGEVVTWRAAFPPALAVGGPPFVIEHELVGAEWGDAARAARAGFAHPLGGPARAMGLSLPVADVAAASVAIRRAVGIPIDPRSGIGGIGAQVIRLIQGGSREPASVEIGIIGSGPLDPSRVEAVGVRWVIGASPGPSES